MTIQVTFKVELPDEAQQCTTEEITDWLRFNVNENGILGHSPISDCELNPMPFSVEWEYI
jgi:hypothetical protein